MPVWLQEGCLHPNLNVNALQGCDECAGAAAADAAGLAGVWRAAVRPGRHHPHPAAQPPPRGPAAAGAQLLPPHTDLLRLELQMMGCEDFTITEKASTRAALQVG